MMSFGLLKKRKPVSVQDAPIPEVIQVDIALMDERFDRSAGRYCVHCGIHGSHHTEAHNSFARAALKRRELHY